MTSLLGAAPFRATYVDHRELLKDAALMQEVIELVNDTFHQLNSSLFLDPEQKRLHNSKELLEEVGVGGGLVLLRATSSSLLATALLRPYSKFPGLPSLPTPHLPSPERVGYCSLVITRSGHGIPSLFDGLHEAIAQHGLQEGWTRIVYLVGEGGRFLNALKGVGFVAFESTQMPIGYLGCKYETSWTWLVKELSSDDDRSRVSKL